ncbi:hypothetical protein A2382_03765 [Candidatus Woesebacteria bacterium RIFOXYB1_FULL_38_16]|uniref:Uncharacterized protein n=1 Tax=Candidatus Woesebacteria bacterium RIFOXYB1_FULL_38_16 TaxID=1802538 RepID=A0A1F8CR04_9BACT|nr:MAG: hypothetical protein A2191_02255 [Candidatus Woesebacteria bacterium RIFOXYA1_FULL_38_9]OGM78767.1 MAG: hypothetical protein A2382_03765 [Candidatus Woesebacteria bacterium RIFOXYB1_FULL_38_16]
MDENKSPLIHLEYGVFDGRQTVAVQCNCGKPRCEAHNVYFVNEIVAEFVSRLLDSPSPEIEERLRYEIYMALKCDLVKACHEQSIEFRAKIFGVSSEQYRAHLEFETIADELEEIGKVLISVTMHLISLHNGCHALDPMSQVFQDDEDNGDKAKDIAQQIKNAMDALRRQQGSHHPGLNKN